MKKEEKNIKEMLALMNLNNHILKKEPKDLKKYKHLNLCEDYKNFLKELGYIDFGELKVQQKHTEADPNMVPYFYDQVYCLAAPGDSFEDEYAYTNKLFYEIGNAYNGDSLVQVHTGKFRGLVMITDHETFPIDSELENDIGDLTTKTADEIIKILLKDYDCLMTLEDMGIENVADFFISKMSTLPKIENKNTKELLNLIHEKSDILKKEPIDLNEYAHLNLCEDYKLFLQELGFVNFKDIGVTDIPNNIKDSHSPLLFNNISQLHKPGNNFAETDAAENYDGATAYTSRLFYEIGTDGSDGSCLVQFHTGNYRGMIMYAEYGEFPLDGELEEEFGPIEKKTSDELVDYLIENHGCFRSLKDIGIENVADFLIKKINTIPMYEKPAGVPAEAVWLAKDKEWELGQKDADGNPIGEWKWWLAPNGHLVCHTFYEGDNKMSFTRFHPDGTFSQKGSMHNKKNVGHWIWQASENPTTENWLQGSMYRCEAKYNDGNLVSVKYWNKEGVEIDASGKPLK